MIDKDAVGYAPDHPAVLASLEAMALGQTGWEALRDECYAWLKVRENVDEGATSNTGERGICWTKGRDGRPVYHIQMKGPWGVRQRTKAAPKSPSDVRTSPLLQKAIETRDAIFAQLVAEYGEPERRSIGFASEVKAVLLATPEGRQRIEGGGRDVLYRISELASTAEAYERQEWNPLNAREVHLIFRAQRDRRRLIRRTWNTSDAKAELARRSIRQNAKPDPFRPVTSVRAHTRGNIVLPEGVKIGLGELSNVTARDDLIAAILAFVSDLYKSEDEALAA